jgi:hypothetical protein
MHSLKKLILDLCAKSVFSCNSSFHEQPDGVSMGCSLEPCSITANIILTEFENIILSELVN